MKQKFIYLLITSVIVNLITSFSHSATLVKSGDTLNYAISLNHLNSIRLPFPNPIVDTSSSVQLQIRDNNLLILPNNNQTISLLVTNPADSSFNLTLLLKPQDIASKSYVLTSRPLLQINQQYQQQNSISIASQLISLIDSNKEKKPLVQANREIKHLAKKIEQCLGYFAFENRYLQQDQAVGFSFRQSIFYSDSFGDSIDRLSSCSLPAVAWTYAPNGVNQLWFLLDNNQPK